MKKFEFLLKINGHIIYQRYFSVKNCNPEITRSMDLYWTCKECVRLVEEDLKIKSENYIWENYRPYEFLKEPIKKIEYKRDVFTFEIKVDDKVVMSQIFSGNPYPQRVRYSVDIRNIIPILIEEIQDTFSQEYLTVEHCGTQL